MLLNDHGLSAGETRRKEGERGKETNSKESLNTVHLRIDAGNKRQEEGTKGDGG
jgi:hypothetical protein